MPGTEQRLDGACVLIVGSVEWLETFTTTLNARSEACIHTVETIAAALDSVQHDPIDCIVTEYLLDETTGVDLISRVRDSHPTLPILLGTTAGSEAIASRAIHVGVTEYIPLTEPDDRKINDLVERTDQALGSAQQSGRNRQRARQFDGIFRDTQTATWVLDSDGSLSRVNETAREMIDDDPEAMVGEPFWSLPWWEQTDATQRDVRKLVEDAFDGKFGSAVVFQPPAESTRVMDLSIRPIENQQGDLMSIVVDGFEVTDQVRLERDLRESEELHRVTLNNMTDTVLITNEDGEYTYVCPNVHFIFGYTAEEIREQGTIESLLGEDLFDRDELAGRGVLKNIECTVRDKADREHTLLVNVREVSIQDGTLLYSCRDITKRKQREESLTALQATAREFQYAETHQEISQQIVDDVSNVLDLSASAVYLFDDAANELHPAVHSQSMNKYHGPLQTVHADGDTLPGYSFVEDETLIFDDVHTADQLTNRATDLRSTMYIPLGSHGVFVVGSPDVGVFDEVAQELADLLAASAEAALDSVAREATLRQQDRELQQQNNRLTDLNRINDTIREIDQAIVQAETQEEIDHTVCELLTNSDRFKFAWIGSTNSVTETVEPRASAGQGQSYLDDQSITIEPSETEPAGMTAATGNETVITNVAASLRDAPWRSNAITRDFLSIMSIPLVYNDFSHGVLSVYADTKDAFDATTRAVLTELGETIASALSAIERKHALLSTSMMRMTFRVEESDFPLSRLAQMTASTLRYDGGIQNTPDGQRVFVTVEDAEVQTVVDAAADIPAIQACTHLRGGGTDSGILRLQLTKPFVALELAEHGAIFREATATPTRTSLQIDVPEAVDVRKIMQLVRNSFTSVELERKQTLERTDHDLHSKFLADLTERQFEVIQTAYYSGYFESPRERTGEEIAATLEISPPAFYQHMRAIQRKLFATLFEESRISNASGETV
jgi:PAS domain S-box-containing protein